MDQPKPQSYKNHIRFYPPHHFIFYPLLIILFGVCLVFAFRDADQRLLWISFATVLLLLGWLSFMMRQHYALNNQNRIVRLELRFRYFALTGKRLEELEDRLSFGQIAALRFASDDELPELTARAVAEQLSPDEIKRTIKTWQPDHMRV
jgi:hypothetical protein